MYMYVDIHTTFPSYSMCHCVFRREVIEGGRWRGREGKDVWELLKGARGRWRRDGGREKGGRMFVLFDLPGCCT